MHFHLSHLSTSLRHVIISTPPNRKTTITLALGCYHVKLSHDHNTGCSRIYAIRLQSETQNSNLTLSPTLVKFYTHCKENGPSANLVCNLVFDNQHDH